jgi:hypothetical protein
MMRGTTTVEFIGAGSSTSPNLCVTDSRITLRPLLEQPPHSVFHRTVCDFLTQQPKPQPEMVPRS